MAVFAHPAGAVIGVWQPGRMKGAQLVNEEGTLAWNELVTSDVEGSKVFYRSIFAGATPRTRRVPPAAIPSGRSATGWWAG